MQKVEQIAVAVLDALDGNRQRPLFTSDLADFAVADAYRAARELRRLRVGRGARPVGRKIGFTNRGIWNEYGVNAPIWGDMFDDTVRSIMRGEVVKVGHLPEPRIEPEIVLELRDDLHHGMSPEQVAGSIGRVAHGFEIVQSIYPGWRFEAADCIADGGLHGMLLLGPWQDVGKGKHAGLATALADVGVELFCNDQIMDRGVGANALDGPVAALTHLADMLGLDANNSPLEAGEMVTTGTLTRAFPIKAGERWATRLEGFGLPGLSIEVG